MRFSLLTVLLVAMALTAIPAAHGYTTTTKVLSSMTGLMAMTAGGPDTNDVCAIAYSGSNTAMPTSPSIQARILETANTAGFRSSFPLGGCTMQATCTAHQCQWQWFRGFLYHNWPVFFRGVYYAGPESSATSNPTPKLAPVDGAYINWDTNFPISWSNLSYWGKRLVVMQPGSGKWRNVEVSTRFTEIVCENIIYTRSDGKNNIVRTFPNGDPISHYDADRLSFCGKRVVIDELGRWIMPKCGGNFPWWGGLVIAVVCYIVVVALIIIVWCCCCVSRRKDDENYRRHVIATEADNKNSIPNQSEVGLSSGRSFSQRSGGSILSDRGSATESDTDN